MTHDVHRTEPALHPFVAQARQLAHEAGSGSDNSLINWGLKLIEDALVFGNKKR